VLADEVLDAAARALSTGATVSAVWPDLERFLLQSGCSSVALIEAGSTARPAQPGTRTLTVPVHGGAVVGHVSAALPDRSEELGAAIRRVAGVLSGAEPSTRPSH
jgi:CelD/BcsL family acetyltransferase involved in cellulose biosynthesis